LRSLMKRASWREKRTFSPSVQFASRSRLPQSIQQVKLWHYPLVNGQGLICPTWRSFVARLNRKS
jgi:hypothetical protein